MCVLKERSPTEKITSFQRWYALRGWIYNLYVNVYIDRCI